MANTAPDIYDFEALSIDGKPAHLATQRGKVLLIVNTASECGFTPQFAGLEALWETYRDRGLVVIGFPSNQFGAQDPGGNDEIASFCQMNYGVSFPMMGKVDVNGDDAHPLWKWLTRRGAGPARHEVDQVELHEVPGRPRRPGDQALRAERHARVDEGRHRSRARGLKDGNAMFEHVEPFAGDPILSLNEDFQKDPRPHKINLSIGIYFDEAGRIPVLDSVRRAEQRVVARRRGQAVPADRRRGQLPRGGAGACCSAPGTRRSRAAAWRRSSRSAPAAA